MKPENSFQIEFDYTLSETIILRLTAKVQLHNSLPHYIVSDFHFKSHSENSPLLPDIDIMAIKTKDDIIWVHTDSFKETILSVVVGKAIEESGDFKIGRHQE